MNRIDFALSTHTEEIKEQVMKNAQMFEMLLDELTDRERKIFEIAFANGYYEGVEQEKDGVAVQVQE